MTVLRLTRRGTLAILAGAAASPFAARGAGAASAESHGMSAFGDLKYPVGFEHFEYVDPRAPKGGTFSQVGPRFAYNQNPNTFNTLNMFVLRGDGAQGLELTFASLMSRAQDEPDAMYGLAAQSVTADADGLGLRFRLRQGITFHDGTPITPADVAFSLDILKREGHPRITQVLSRMESASAEGEVVAVRFSPDRARDAPLFVAGLPILSKAYYAGRRFDAATLEAPLGCGPYRVGRMEPGRFIEYARVKDWWGADLPAMRGSNNFDVVRYEYFRDRDVGFEAFKAGEYLFREEFTSRVWARGYDFPAVKDGRVVRDEIADNTPSGTQGWFLNTRREIFKDRRVREAVQLAFDFEWVNRNVMFGSYRRAYSFFQNSDLEAHGEPDAAELALLEPLRQYAAEQLEGSGETGEVTRRFATYYLALLAARTEDLRGSQQQAALDELSAEITHIRGAWRWAVAHMDADAITPAIDSMFHFYDMRSWFGEGIAAFTALSQATSAHGADRQTALTHGMALARQGWFTFHLGRQTEAKALLEQSLDVLRAHTAHTELVFSLNYLAAVCQYLGEYARSRALGRESLAITEAVGDQYGRAVMSNILGQVAYECGDYDAARTWSQQSLAIEEQIGNRWSMAYSLTNLGKVAYAQGAYTDARALVSQSLAIREAMRDTRGVAICLNRLGEIAVALHEPAEAGMRYAQSLALSYEIGNRWGSAASLIHLAQL
ncbi:MAG: tetratricopeptide repeat protein, partial [Bacteroidales bacterium]|nr:tetratricopeptide repeat protein [Bacteroidales bacterium]